LSTLLPYLTDLLKQGTGKTVLDHLHLLLIDEAKTLLLTTDQMIAQTAYELGFENLPYFSWLFKKVVGLMPHEYRAQFLNGVLT
jgi:AraC family transcriptional activator of pobA